MSTLARAIAIAAVAFQDKVDKGGQPYMLHCLRVMNAVGPNQKQMTVGVLHDVVEDCPEWTIDKLRERGFTDEVLTPLWLLTHPEDMDYQDYIKRLASHPVAKAVKIADLIDNSNITRLKGLRQKDIERVHKYHVAYTYLAG